MDKNTFGGYGWIICIVIILVILMRLAIPFGEFITTGVKSALTDFKSTADFAMANASSGSNEETDGEEDDFESQVPTVAAGLYKTGTNYTELVASWDTLLANNIVSEDGHAHFGDSIYPTYEAMDALAGDLVIPEGVTELPDYAYSTCDKLTGIMLPQSLISIGEYAFDYCDGLTEVVIPDNVISIGENAFEESMYIEKLTIGPNVTSIGDYAFANCIGLTSVTFKDGATIIGPWMFYNCESLVEVIMPGTITTICEGAFDSCWNLTSIDIPAGATSINPRAFEACEGVSSITVDVNNSVYYSVNNCLIETNTKTLVLACANSVIPDDGSVMHIGDYAFCTTSEITSIVIPEGITSIGTGAFSYCQLTSINIPSSVESIGAYAFNNCSQLTTVTFEENSNLSIIGEAAFNGSSKLARIEIPDSVTVIGRSAFGACVKLASVSIGKEASQLNEIGESAFYNCQGLTALTFAGQSDKWETVSLGSNWCKLSRLTHVVCLDESISLN